MVEKELICEPPFSASVSVTSTVAGGPMISGVMLSTNANDKLGMKGVATSWLSLATKPSTRPAWIAEAGVPTPPKGKSSSSVEVVLPVMKACRATVDGVPSSVMVSSSVPPK